MQCGCPEQERERLEADRWTDSIAAVLQATEGRKMFRRYLESASLQEDVDTLSFYEDAEALATAIHLHRNAATKAEREERRQEVEKRIELLIQFAFDYVNLDVRQLRELDRLREEPAVALEVISRTRQTCRDLLDPAYQAYRQSLIKAANSVTY